ncbi:MAG: AAA family ATPase [Spirochaetia bacterium]|nr:AAA family ATPase [Spirochaetia bacterium]
MPSAKQLRQIFQTVNSGDKDSFRRIAEEVIRDERAKQHHLLANDLERILYGKTDEKSSLLHLNSALPQDKERGVPLLSLLQPARNLEDIVLSDENLSVVQEILLEYNRKDILRAHGLRAADKLLFYGPPGCGKTVTAEVIAYELELPLAVLRIDSIVSSFLGETSANLRGVFEFLQSKKMVVLFDEFDAVGRERADKSEHGEIKRVVNALLQMLDNYKGESLLIAATNHESTLDTAVWRRFEEVLEFNRPNIEQIKKLLALKLRGVRQNLIRDTAAWAKSFNGLTHADIERILRRAIKEMVLQNREFLEDKHIEASLKREEARQKTIQRSLQS